jgi:hypothetical protein
MQCKLRFKSILFVAMRSRQSERSQQIVPLDYSRLPHHLQIDSEAITIVVQKPSLLPIFTTTLTAVDGNLQISVAQVVAIRKLAAFLNAQRYQDLNTGTGTLKERIGHRLEVIFLEDVTLAAQTTTKATNGIVHVHMLCLLV